jgi:hypothetical protein
MDVFPVDFNLTLSLKVWFKKKIILSLSGSPISIALSPGASSPMPDTPSAMSSIN